MARPDNRSPSQPAFFDLGTANRVLEATRQIEQRYPPTGSHVRTRQTFFPVMSGGGSVGVSNIYPWMPFVAPVGINPTSSPSWWRTIQVLHGTVNNVLPRGNGTTNYSTSDDTTTSHTLLVLPASSTLLVYLGITIANDISMPSEGNVTAASVYFSATNPPTVGWTDYPNEPLGDSSTGAPPGSFFLFLYSITTGADPMYIGSGPYLAGTLTLPTEWSYNNFWIDEVSFGGILSGVDGCYTQKRMSARAV